MISLGKTLWKYTFNVDAGGTQSDSGPTRADIIFTIILNDKALPLIIIVNNKQH